MNTLTNPTRNMPCHIRVKRGSDNLLKAFVNGVEDISQSVTQDLCNHLDTCYGIW